MHRKRSPPPPSRASERIKEYLDIINSKQSQHGGALRYDFYRRAGSEAQTDRVIKYLEERGFIKRTIQEGKEIFKKTEEGEKMHAILKYRELIGIITRELSGDRIKRW